MEHLQATNLKLSFLKFLVSLYMRPSTRRWLRALAAVESAKQKPNLQSRACSDAECYGDFRK